MGQCGLQPILRGVGREPLNGAEHWPRAVARHARDTDATRLGVLVGVGAAVVVGLGRGDGDGRGRDLRCGQGCSRKLPNQGDPPILSSGVRPILH
jgi:hypothetical protein